MHDQEFNRLKQYLLSVSKSPELVASVLDPLHYWFEAASGRCPVLRPIDSHDSGETAYAIAAVIGREVDCLRQISERSPLVRSLAGLRPLHVELANDQRTLGLKFGLPRWAETQTRLYDGLASGLDSRFRQDHEAVLGEKVWYMARRNLRECFECAVGWAVAGNADRTHRFKLLLRIMQGAIVLGEMPDRPGWWVVLAA